MCDDMNTSICSSKFHNELKEADIVPVYKKSQNYLKNIIDLLVFFQISPRFMKDTYMIKCHNFLIISFQSISVIFERVTAHNTAF